MGEGVLVPFIQNNIYWAPFILFGLLILAGFFIPISEDLVLFVGGILSAKNPEYLWWICGGIFLGAYGSDMICYGIMGRSIGIKIFQYPFFSRFISPPQIEKMNHFYRRYGIAVILVGRFIPFGVRNALFFSAGLSKMNFIKFASTNFVACSMTCSLYFFLYYQLGESVLEYVKKSNMVLISLFVIFVLGILGYKKYCSKVA